MSDPAAHDELHRVAKLLEAITTLPAPLRPTQHPVTRHLPKVLARADQLLYHTKANR